MKEAIRMVPESIYDPEFPDASHSSSGRGCHSVLRRIKEEWGTSRWFLEFDIRKCFHTIDRHIIIQILKEEIDDPKFFYSTQKQMLAGRLVGGELVILANPDSVPHSVLLSALLGNIYLHKLDQEIGRIRHKHEIPLVQRIRSVLLRTGKSMVDDKEQYLEEASFKAPQDKRAIIVGRVKSTQRKATFHSLVSSWHTPNTSTPRRRGDQKTPFVFPLLSAAFLNKPSSLLCAALLLEAAGLTPKAQFYGMEGFHYAMRRNHLLKYCKRRGLLIELGGESVLVIRSERSLARKLAPFKTHDSLIRICYARYADDLLLGIVGSIELIIEIKNRINHFLQSGLNLLVGSAGSTTIAARSTVEFPGTVIREVPPRTKPILLLRELEKRLRVKHRIHLTAFHLRCAIHSKFRDLGNSLPIKELTKGMSYRGSLLDAVKLAPTHGTAGVISPKACILWGTYIWQGSREISLLHSSGRSNVPSDVKQSVSMKSSGTDARKCSLSTHASRKSAGEIEGHWARSFSSEFPIQIRAPIKKILRRLRDRGLISQRRPRPIHVASLTNVSDGDIVNWYAGFAISLLSYYRCCDNLYQVRTIVDYQIRWSAIFTPAHKHKSSARNIIQKYSKDSNIVNQEGGKTLAQFPNSIELGKYI
uniref:Maturase-related protein n=1 Tax=Musa beccarii TaxID=192045 RepID=A0A8D5TD64_MUSBE|nr:maturase-related protein [Musa beccarii]